MAKCYKSASGGLGQSLVEVIVAVGAMSVLLVALLSLVSLSLKNTRLARDRAQAVALAQEGVELMRAFRDYNWSQFKGRADGSNYHLPGNWVVADGLSQSCQTTPGINNVFWRCAQLESLAANEVLATITAGWYEGGRSLLTTQTTNLSLWER